MFRFSLADSLPPPAVGESCLHRLFRLSSCQACAEACPVDALTITGQGVSLAQEKCLRCGNCLFVCPANALVHLAPPRRNFCEHRLIAPFTPFPPTLNELLIWHVQYRIRGVDMDLDEHPHWGVAIAALNLKLSVLNEPRWQIFPPQKSELDHGRRRFLSANREQSGCAGTDINLLSKAFVGLSLYTPQLDAGRCILCAACSRVCSQKAIKLEEESFTLNAEDCNGCEACKSVCPVDAITITQEIRPARRIIHRLYWAHCSGCARQFLSWNQQVVRCPICLQHYHGMR